MNDNEVIAINTVSAALSKDALSVQFRLSHDECWEHGTHWKWIAGGEVYTAQGMQMLAEKLDEENLSTDALIVRGMRTPLRSGKLSTVIRPKRVPLPYHDRDDEEIYAIQHAHHEPQL